MAAFTTAMTSEAQTKSFDDIIKAGRQRKKDEAFANEIFGKGRRSSTPNNTGRGKAIGASGLASRISKPSQRSSSSSPAFRANQARPVNPSSRARSFQGSNVLSSAAPSASLNSNDRGFSIKGIAGPSVVVGSNFAPGTTSADIQSAMESVGGPMESCRIIASSPTVIVEMVFTERACAEAVISTFNNQKADGRLLHLWLKQGGPSPVVPTGPSSANKALEPKVIIEERRNAPSAFGRVEEYSSRNGSGRRADPEYQDGRYGFSKKDDEMVIDEGDETTREDRRGDGYRDDADDRYNDRRDEGRKYARDTRGERDVIGYRREQRPPLGGSSSDKSRLYSDEYYPRQRGRGYDQRMQS